MSFWIYYFFFTWHLVVKISYNLLCLLKFFYLILLSFLQCLIVFFFYFPDVCRYVQWKLLSVLTVFVLLVGHGCSWAGGNALNQQRAFLSSAFLITWQQLMGFMYICRNCTIFILILSRLDTPPIDRLLHEEKHPKAYQINGITGLSDVNTN